MLNHTLWDEPNTSFRKPPCLLTASLMAQTVKNLPAMWETRVWSLGRENLLEKEMATHSSILAWRIPRTEKPSGLQSMGSQRVGHDCAMNTLTCLLIHLSYLIATQGSCLHLRSHGRSGNNTKFRGSRKVLGINASHLGGKDWNRQKYGIEGEKLRLWTFPV